MKLGVIFVESLYFLGQGPDDCDESAVGAQRPEDVEYFDASNSGAWHVLSCGHVGRSGSDDLLQLCYRAIGSQSSHQVISIVKTGGKDGQ